MSIAKPRPLSQKPADFRYLLIEWLLLCVTQLLEPANCFHCQPYFTAEGILLCYNCPYRRHCDAVNDYVHPHKIGNITQIVGCLKVFSPNFIATKHKSHTTWVIYHGVHSIRFSANIKLFMAYWVKVTLFNLLAILASFITCSHQLRYFDQKRKL